ncbi:MAG TPA: FHA domain-containing protein [Candidatus Eisenbacteria bacterium]
MSTAASAQAPEPGRLLRIRVSLNGRPLKSQVFDKDVVLVGRDPECDVVLDNTGVSRHHLKFELGPTGFYSVTDLGSANGTLFNEQPLKKDFIYSGGDVLQIGKFTLWVTRESDRRADEPDRRPTPEAEARTTVLSATELLKIEQEARQRRMASITALPTAAPVAEKPQVRRESKASPRMTHAAALLVGLLAGMLVQRLLSLVIGI